MLQVRARLLNAPQPRAASDVPVRKAPLMAMNPCMLVASPCAGHHLPLVTDGELDHSLLFWGVICNPLASQLALWQGAKGLLKQQMP